MTAPIPASQSPNLVRFDAFLLESRDRRLTRDGAAVEISGRYFDALALLVGEAGRLVTKDRFLDEVWKGVPVTDEALTQCIRTLRRALGDDAAGPRFIETVPKHGYRFIAPIMPVAAEDRSLPRSIFDGGDASPWRNLLAVAGAGTIGGAGAGLLGGLFYGLAGAQASASGTGGLSTLLVMAVLTTGIATLGAAGVSMGIAIAHCTAPRRWWASLIGGAAGGGLIGAAVKLLGLDAFNLLLGQSPGNITGGAEGVLLGAAAGLGLWFARRLDRSGRSIEGVAVAALVVAGAGALIAMMGGRLMGGSLDLLGQGLAGSRLNLDAVGALFGEQGFGLLTRIFTSLVEGLLFGAGIAAAMLWFTGSGAARRATGAFPRSAEAPSRAQ